MDYICNLRKVHLEWLGIGIFKQKNISKFLKILERIENLNFFEKLQILFLQHVLFLLLF